MQNIGVRVICPLLFYNYKYMYKIFHLASLPLLGIKEESTLLLRNFYKSEEIFLDMFEDEYRETAKSWRYCEKIEFILSDASLLLPPAGTPLTGIEFSKRLPCGAKSSSNALRCWPGSRWPLKKSKQSFQMWC